MVEQFIYNVLIRFYRVAIGLASPFNSKASRWISGRKNWRNRLKEFDKAHTGKRIWIHAASLGEFEQGRPIIERLKADFPEKNLILTFFSPSGYEIRKDFDGVDLVTYLPLDTKKNAKDFVDIISPELAIFIKYEFWFNHLFELKNKSIPTILVSGRMHSKQGFFRSWGGFFKQGLDTFDHFFLQDGASAELLSEIGFDNTTVNGDTRFDRVISMQAEDKRFPEIENFCGTDPVIVLGSSWLYDEILIQKYVSTPRPGKFKLIMAPHEIDEKRIAEFQKNCALPSIKLSEWSARTGNEQVMIVDSIGKLSYVYRYATLAMIGGGFGAGIHNSLEAAVWACPLVFGPRYEMFHEAVHLVEEGAAFPVESQVELDEILDKLLFGDETHRELAGQMAWRICETGQGASAAVLNHVKSLLDD